MSKHQLALVTGIDNINGQKGYRVVLVSYTEKEPGQYDWDFKCAVKPESWIASNINSIPWLNIGIENGKIKGTSGSLTRFNNGVNHPVVIVSQLSTSDGNLVGYKIIDYDGNVKNIKLKAMLEYGIRTEHKGGIPVQNAMFVKAEEGRREHFKSYPDHPFIEEILVVHKNPHVNRANVNVNQNEKSLTRIEEIFSKDQLVQLKKGKEEGINYKLYANPNLSAKQMEALREALKRNVNIRPFASPDFKVECMRYYAATAAVGGNISNIINPNYTVNQLSELYCAIESGIDISEFADPKISAKDMQTKRIIAENKIYFEKLIIKDEF